MKTGVKFFIGVIVSMLLLPSAFATTYTTLQAGNWDDAIVWSTNGMVTCNCTPAMNANGEVALSQDTVVVNHEINLYRTLKIFPAGRLEISSGGILIQPQNGIKVIGGKLESQGQITTQSLDNQSGGTMIVNNYLLLVGGGVNNKGFFYLNHQVNSVDDPSGSNGSTQLLSGEFLNDGLLQIGTGSCINIGDNNFENQSAGTVFGAGYIYTTGTLINNGSWSSNTAWCAGSSSGSGSLPNPDCSQGTCDGPQEMLRRLNFEEQEAAFVPKEQEPVQLYPNPFQDSFTIRFDRNAIELGGTVTLQDLSGRTLMVKTLTPGQTEVTLNPEDLSNGFYLVNVTLENGDVHRMKVQQVR